MDNVRNFDLVENRDRFIFDVKKEILGRELDGIKVSPNGILFRFGKGREIEVTSQTGVVISVSVEVVEEPCSKMTQ
jgi:hypothetical protein